MIKKFIRKIIVILNYETAKWVIDIRKVDHLCEKGSFEEAGNYIESRRKIFDHRDPALDGAMIAIQFKQLDQDSP